MDYEEGRNEVFMVTEGDQPLFNFGNSSYLIRRARYFSVVLYLKLSLDFRHNSADVKMQIQLLIERFTRTGIKQIFTPSVIGLITSKIKSSHFDFGPHTRTCV